MRGGLTYCEGARRERDCSQEIGYLVGERG